MRWPDDYINKVICGDCLGVMKGIPDGAVDCVITDPPYGVRKKEGWDDKDYFRQNLPKWFKGLKKVSPGLIWFCADKMLPNILMNRAAPFHRLLVWNKPPGSQFAGASNNNLWYSIEPILLFGKPDYWALKGKSSSMGFSFFDSHTIPKSKYSHPTTKPIRLMEWLIDHYTNPDDIILDPFAGSGTTLVAAKQLGRKYIGIEINPEYCKIAEDRLKQGELFNQEAIA